jgi:adenylate cyclase
MKQPTVRTFLRELRRRRVYRVAVVYVVVGWGMLQLGNVVVEPLRLPEWTMSMIIVLLALGFPVAMILAWAFEITPEGVRRTEPITTAGPPPAASVESARGRAAYTGLGILIGIVAIGAYAYMQDGPAPGDGDDAEPDAVRSLAVLPFANASPAAEDEIFADGMTDDILTQLAVVPDFSVISRTTTMRYRGSDLSVRDIAAELDVQYVLEGSVRRVDDQVRITAQLVDGRTDQNLWAETYDRRLRDIFRVQTDIAQAIVDALEARLSSGVAARMERAPTEDMEAYDLFLLGRQNFYNYTLAGTERAIEALRSALERDPEFSLARAWLGRAYVSYAYNYGAGEAWADSAVAMARQAVAEQPDLPDAHTALGTALITHGRFSEGEAALERAIELNPNDWAAMANLGLAYGVRGRQDEAIRLTRQSLRRDPARSFVSYSNMAGYLAQLGLWDRAEEVIQRSLQLRPDYAHANHVLAAVHLHHGRHAEALAIADRLAQDPSPRPAMFGGQLLVQVGEVERARDVLARVYERNPGAVSDHLAGVLYGYTLDHAGMTEQARAILADTEVYARTRIEGGDQTPNLHYALAAIHALRGESDAAFHWLDEAIRAGWNGAKLTVDDPILDNIRGDPRFPAALEHLEEDISPMRARVEREGF